MGCILLASVGDWGNNILSWVQEKAGFLLDFLPSSPFRKAIDLIGNIPYIDTINWFLPIEEIIMILMWWGSAITLYYAYMIILRWIKALN